MRNRRFTISVVMALALISTPKVWQKFNDLLAAVQHQAQSKLLNMGLNSQAQAYDERVLTPVAQTEYVASSCPNSQLNRISETAHQRSPVLRVRTKERPASVGSTEHGALAFDSKSVTTRQAPLPSPDGALARASENLLTMHGVNSLPTPLAMKRSDIVEVVMLPRPDQGAPAFIEKDPDLNIKMKKVLEETKALRQRVRFVMVKSNPLTLPSS